MKETVLKIAKTTSLPFARKAFEREAKYEHKMCPCFICVTSMPVLGKINLRIVALFLTIQRTAKFLCLILLANAKKFSMSVLLMY